VQIHFYMPESCLPPEEEMPFWLAGNPRKFELPGKASTAQNWILLTCGHLRSAGADVSLSSKIPDSGIVIALTGNLPAGYRAPSGTFLVGVVADGLPHPACHFHVVQNEVHAQRLPRSLFLPHWPQPGLIPRDPGRGDRFENLVFYGDPPNLAPELRDPSFAENLKSRLGISFQIAGSADWHDYSQTDCVLAVREFGQRPFLRKPATKLYNAWLAGAPFIGGSDSAFSADGRHGVDFLRCTSIREVDDAIRSLHESPDFRHRIVAAGREASGRFAPWSTLARWREALEKIIPGAAAAYFSNHRSGKFLYEATQRTSIAWDRLRGFS